MDTHRPIQPRSLWRRHWYLGPLMVVVGGVLLARQSLGNASHIIDQDDIQLAVVQRGNFRIDVRGVGILKPVSTKWESSQVSGWVEQLLVKPGEMIETDQPLLRLSNPELQREVERTRWELDATRAEAQAERVVLESQLVDLENTAVAAELDIQSTQLKLDAETELMKSGGLISRLDHRRTQLALQQHQHRWQSQRIRVDKMRANLEAIQRAQQARLGLIENNLERAIEQVDDLTVRATTAGVVQQISLQPGEQAVAGRGVVLVASQQSLIAQLNIQELQIRDVAVGQPAIIDTRSSQIRGQVVRIDPAVEAGMVQVEVTLLDRLPAEARPDLNVEGRIEVSNIADTLYVQRPTFAPQFAATELFRLTPDARFAEKTRVELGRSSVNIIQIVNGLEAGDSIIVSDTNHWQQHASVRIK